VRKEGRKDVSIVCAPFVSLLSFSSPLLSSPSPSPSPSPLLLLLLLLLLFDFKPIFGGD